MPARLAPQVSFVLVLSACWAVSQNIGALEMVRDKEAPPLLNDYVPPQPSIHCKFRVSCWRVQLGWALLLPESAVHAPAAVLGKLTAGAMSEGLSQRALWYKHCAVPGHPRDDQADNLCYQLQVYLGHGLDKCSWKILAQVLFTETHRERQTGSVA